MIAGVRSEEAGRRLAAEASDRLRVVQLDVADEPSVRAAAETVGDHRDVLVNNAGIAVGGVLEALPLADLRHQLEVNVVGQVAVTQALPARPPRDVGPHRLHLVGVRARVRPGLTPYAASKFAIEAIADGLRVERASGASTSSWSSPARSTPTSGARARRS